MFKFLVLIVLIAACSNLENGTVDDGTVDDNRKNTSRDSGTAGRNQ